MRQGVAKRAQAIAIQLRADKLAIRENQRGGAIPWLTLLRKRGQGAAHVAREQGILFKGGRNHGEHGFFRRQPFEQPQFETVVKTRGIADVFFEKWEPRAHREPRAELGCFGAEPAAVRDEGIYLPPVWHGAETRGQKAGKRGVGGRGRGEKRQNGCEGTGRPNVL